MTRKTITASGSGPTSSSWPRRSNQLGNPPIGAVLDEHAGGTPPTDQPGQRDDERRQPEAGDAPAVDEAGDGGRERARRRWPREPARRARAAVARTAADQRHHRSDGEVDLAGDDDERHRDDDDHLLDVELEQVDEVVDAEVAGRLRDVEDDDRGRMPASRSSHVYRRAQLAMCDAAFHQAARDVLPPPPLAEAPGDRHVEDDGQQDQRAEDRVTPELADLRERGPGSGRACRSARRRGTRR